MIKFASKKTALITLAVMLVVVLIGSIIFGVCKLNYGADVKGAVEVSVSLDEDSTSSSVAKKYSDDIASIIKKQGFSFASSARTETDASGFKTLVYTLKSSNANKTIEKLGGDFKTKLTEYFATAYDGTSYSFDFDKDVEINKVGGQYSCSYVTKTFLAMAVLALIATVYFIIRYGFASGFTCLISAILDLAVTLSLIAIFRVKVNGYLVSVIPFCVIYSLVLSLIAFSHLKGELGKKPDRSLIEEKTISSGEVVSKIALYVGIGLIVAFILMVCIMPVELKFVSLYMIIAVLVCTCEALLFKPVLRLWFSKLKKEKVTGYAKYAKVSEKEE